MKRGSFGWIAACGLALGVVGCKHAPEQPATPEPTAPPQTTPQQPGTPQQPSAPAAATTPAATPAQAANLACTLSVTPTARAGAPVEVELKLTNHSAKTVYVLRWQTPLEGQQLMGDAFRVTRSGTELPYKGAQAKRGNPGTDSYAKIAPKGSVDGRTDISQAYGLTTPGRYRIEFRGSLKIVYRRYAGLFFCACVDANDNELAYLEALHFFVEVLDQFFGNVCELDLVFNFYKVWSQPLVYARITLNLE